MTVAKLPLAKDIEEFDFTGTPINEGLVRELANGSFVTDQRNVVLIGGTGADLQGSADRTVHLLRLSGKASRSGPVVGSRPERRSSGPRDKARVRGELAGLWGSEGLAPAGSGRLRFRPLHSRQVDGGYGDSRNYPRQAA